MSTFECDIVHISVYFTLLGWMNHMVSAAAVIKASLEDGEEWDYCQKNETKKSTVSKQVLVIIIHNHSLFPNRRLIQWHLCA